MSRDKSFDQVLTDALAPIADASPLPAGLQRIPDSWVRSGSTTQPRRLLAIAAVLAAASILTLAGIAAVRGDLSARFIGGPRQPEVIASLEPAEMRTIEEADGIIGTTLTPEESAMLVNAHGAIVAGCMQDLGWDFRVGTATPETEAGGPGWPTHLEQWSFDDVAAAESDGYGFEAYIAEHAAWLDDMDEADGGALGSDPDTMSPDDAARYYEDFFGTDAERIEITERDGSGAGRAGGGCMAEADRALYGDIAREMWLRDARGTAESDIWIATIEDGVVVNALDGWRDCAAHRDVFFADPEQARHGAFAFARAGNYDEERRIATADAVCNVESGLGRAVQAAFLSATNEVLPALEDDLRALQQLEQDALDRAKDILGERGSP
ncbi:MAG TPA: hypothetical protein VFN76_11845 [Candidatus Limnocylindria bacterium]|nr:hypothetical protein [Candidatus Limnocylindria bacterium]